MRLKLYIDKISKYIFLDLPPIEEEPPEQNDNDEADDGGDGETSGGSAEVSDCINTNIEELTSEPLIGKKKLKSST